MKYSLIILFFFISSISFGQLPNGFIYANDMISDLEVDLRYFGSNNFVGKPIDGYNNNCLILTEETVIALDKIQKELKKQNLGLKVYDGYRPQRAVNHFIIWARDLNDTINKSRFYPDVKKKDLFKEEYIATRSGHTKGSTVDLTLIDLKTKKELDMGSIYDFFGVQSWVDYQHISEAQIENRKLLQHIMLSHGFRNYPREWWHFTLRNQPFPNTYFDFPIE
ncbi:M15 family metallopeptidase [Algibacter sp. 2305UL17-15]|uniref:M15 family metallopeptidase n=1 Tax=Algibacter sp. 2305UL17-15 TaxID=3231268 RepID=UPI0034590231